MIRASVLVLVAGALAVAASLPTAARFLPGPVNGLLVNGKVVVYGDSGSRVKKASYVLFSRIPAVTWCGPAFRW